MSETNDKIHEELGKHSDCDDLDLYLNQFLGRHQTSFKPGEIGWHPAADLYETEDDIVIKVDLAGVKISELSLILDKDSISLAGIRKEITNQEKRQYHEMEIQYGQFERAFKLPSAVCPDMVKAVYKDGFLTVRLQKREEHVSKKTIIKIK
jgi:HSP20 family protein